MGCCEARPDLPQGKFDKVHFNDERLKLLINNSFIEVDDDLDNDLFGDKISSIDKNSKSRKKETKTNNKTKTQKSGKNSSRRVDPTRLSTQSTPEVGNS